MPPLYGESDSARLAEGNKASTEDYRSAWRRDQARLIHCPSFRRLQGKTQVFPGHEGDFFRNRLTHSLEVAQIAKSIAIKLNSTFAEFEAPEHKLEPDLVEFAGLAHDLGHPPFGHNGEEALDHLMRDFGGFEGNAQTLRILSRLEKKAFLDAPIGPQPEHGQAELRCGLNLAFRSLASVLKYDRPIPERFDDRSAPGVMKGYYRDDAELVRNIKKAVVGDEYAIDFKTVECSIMDIADDIAYSTYDLEDVFKSGVLKPMDLFVLDKSIYNAVLETINKRLRKEYGDDADAVDEADIKQILHYLLVDLFQIDDEQEEILGNEEITSKPKKCIFQPILSRSHANWPVTVIIEPHSRPIWFSCFLMAYR